MVSPVNSPVPVSEANAKSVLKLALLPADGGSCPSSGDVDEAAHALVKAGRAIDDPELAAEVIGSVSGGGLLHQVAWHAGAALTPMENACRVARALLGCGAKPNQCVHGYRPVDMLVAGVRNGPDECANLEPFVELLLQHGFNHEVAGKYSLEEITSLLRKEGVSANVVSLIELGPDAVLLEEHTSVPSLSRPRRTL